MLPLRILFVWEWLVVGGAERYLIRKARWLCARGHEVWVASAGGPLLDELLATGARHVTLPTLSQGVGAPTLRDAVEDVARLYELIEMQAIDVVDTVATKPFLYVSAVCRSRGVPHVLEALSPCHLAPRDARAEVAALFAKGGVVAMEAGMGHAYRAHGIDTAGVVVIPNAVDTEVFRPPAPRERALARSALGVSDAERLVLTVSRLDADKLPYVERLLEEFRAVAAAVPEARLVIAGDGACADVVRTKARQLLGDRAAHKPGTKDIAQVAAWYRAADVFVGMGTTVLEAAASGVPTIVANDEFMVAGKSPARDRAAAGVFGLDGFVGIGPALGPSPSSFETRLVPLLLDADARLRISAAGRDAVAAAFTTDVVMSQWESYYDALRSSPQVVSASAFAR